MSVCECVCVCGTVVLFDKPLLIILMLNHNHQVLELCTVVLKETSDPWGYRRGKLGRMVC